MFSAGIFHPNNVFLANSLPALAIIGLVALCALAQRRPKPELKLLPVMPRLRASPGVIDRIEEADTFRLQVEHSENQSQETRRDPLTGLPDRLAFAVQLQTAIRHARVSGACSSVLLIGLDGLKKVNERHGKPVGDRVLCEIARRLEGMLLKNDTLARLGGDEFVVIAEAKAEKQAHRDAAKLLAGRMLGKIRQPIAANDTHIRIGAKIGIALCRRDSSDAAQLLDAANAGMVRAKGSGRGSFGLFDQGQDDEMRELEAVEDDLIKAIAEESVLPYFQPVIDIRANRVSGFEALARWQHPKRGFVAPDVFIPIVERLGMMTDMTESILRQACRAATLWPNDIWIAVNVSASELGDPLFPQRILVILEEEGLAPSRLEIEITETALLSDIELAKASLAVLKAVGISMALDDFGTGYASLEQLRQLQFDKLKIDRTFVQGMQGSAECEKIVDAVLGLARSLDLRAVAEGIETVAVLASLASKACEYGQGFLFGKAMTARDAGALLKAGRAPSKAA